MNSEIIMMVLFGLLCFSSGFLLNLALETHMNKNNIKVEKSNTVEEFVYKIKEQNNCVDKNCNNCEFNTCGICTVDTVAISMILEQMTSK